MSDKTLGLSDEQIKSLVPEAYREFLNKEELAVLAYLKMIKESEEGRGELEVTIRDHVVIEIAPRMRLRVAKKDH
jgi:hypothetical protein